MPATVWGGGGRGGRIKIGQDRVILYAAERGFRVCRFKV